jgi:hypothetical protein
VAFVHGNILTSFAICSLQSLGRVESRLFAEPSESIDIELKRPEPKWKWKLSLTCIRSTMSRTLNRLDRNLGTGNCEEIGFPV